MHLRLFNFPRSRQSHLSAAAIALLTFLALFSYSALTGRLVHSVSSSVVISEIYGGGGNSGAVFKNDFIELFNRGGTSVSVTGWSVQYSSASGTTWQVTTLSGSIAPGGYYLIQQAAGAGGTTDLPSPDATGTISMSASSGKVALVNSSTALSGSCPSGSGIIDLVGYGSASCFEGSPTSTLDNTTAAIRGSNGCAETDDNAADFVSGAPNPRNSGSPQTNCQPAPVAIHDVQGAGLMSPFNGQIVSTTGVVSALRSGGFFIQTPDSETDADPNTSEGLFVFTAGAPPAAAAVGNKVAVTGLVTEFRP
jgi:predicted extracellular nuclease